MSTPDRAARDAARGQSARVGAQTLDRGLQVLEAVAQAPAPLSIAEVAATVGIHRTVAHRLAGTLADRGYLYKEPAGRYRLGGTCLALAPAISDLRSLARPVLEDLARRTEETVHLVVLSGRDVTFIDGIESPRVLRVASRIGQRYPAHATSVGKAWLATLGASRLRELYPDDRLEQVTARTLGRRTDLERVLADVRQCGYATNEEESETGVGSVGAVARDSAGQPRAGLSVALPLGRLTGEARPAVTEALVAAAAALSARLL